MTITDDIEALLESSEKVVREREAAEDLRKEQARKNPASSTNNDRYKAERDANDKRRARTSGDNRDDIVMRDADDEASANGSDRNRRDRRSGSPRRRLPPRPSYSPQPMEAPTRRAPSSFSPPPMERTQGPSSRERPTGSYYNPGGRPARDEWRPGSRGGRDDRSRRTPPSRDRSRSPPRGRHSRDDRAYRQRHDSNRLRSPPRGGHGGPRRPPASQPEPTDDERDRRTVFVQQLAARLRTEQLKDFFMAAGPVRDAQIVKDRVSSRSKGVGYVEFADEESVQRAIGLTGQKLCGIPIIAQLTEAEKNRQARTEGPTQTNGVPFHRLYVGNIHFSITEDDLKDVFEPFGELEFVQLQKEEHLGRSKGYGFVQYHDPAQAKEALEKMNGFELAGRAVRVGLGNDKFTNESTQHILRSQGQQFTGSSFSGMGGRGAHAGGTANFDRTSGKDAEKAGGASALDDTDVGGVNFSNYSRDSLMRKLARTEDSEPKVQPKTTQQKKVPVAQNPPSRCVLLKNMYNQAEETEPKWQAELEDDVKTECEEKYGKVMHIGLALDNNEGEIYIKFDRVQGGENAIRGLNGRWFGGRMISADYVIEAMYNANFPGAKNL